MVESDCCCGGAGELFKSVSRSVAAMATEIKSQEITRRIKNRREVKRVAIREL